MIKKLSKKEYNKFYRNLQETQLMRIGASTGTAMDKGVLPYVDLIEYGIDGERRVRYQIMTQEEQQRYDNMQTIQDFLGVKDD